MANKVLVTRESTIIFGSEGGDDVAWSTESITDLNGRQSALHDFGATAMSRVYEYRFHTQCQATPTLGAPVDVYMKTADASNANPDNDDGTGDAAVSASDKLRNLHYVNSAAVDQAAANIQFVASGLLRLVAREISFVMQNETNSTITTDVAETKLRLTPAPDEIQ